MTVIKRSTTQPEFRSPIWDYLAALVDDERVADGRAKLAGGRHPSGPSRRLMVSTPETVVAVWGVESNYGRNFGKRPLVTSLGAVLLRPPLSYFRGEFFTTLKILQEGHVAPEHLNGSWAGAFGHTQFMPSTFMRVALDFDGDGRRPGRQAYPMRWPRPPPLVDRAGAADEPWGYEVRLLPAGFDEKASPGARSASRWRSGWRWG